MRPGDCLCDVWAGCCAVAGRGRIGHGTRIQISLADCIRRAAEQCPAGQQTTRRQGRTSHRTNPVIGNRDRGCDRYITRICHDEVVSERIADGCEVACASNLFHIQRTGLIRVNRLRGLRRQGRAGLGRRDVRDAARIQIGLADRI